MRLLAVATQARLPEFPAVPTFAELGYPALDFANWTGVIASSQMPAALVEKIHAVLRKVAANPAVRASVANAGFEPMADRTPGQARDELREEFTRNAGIVKRYDIRLN